MSTEKLRGFQLLDPQSRSEVSSLGGRKAHALQRAHQFTPEEAQAAAKLSWVKPRRPVVRSRGVKGQVLDMAKALELDQEITITEQQRNAVFVAIYRDLKPMKFSLLNCGNGIFKIRRNK